MTEQDQIRAIAELDGWEFLDPVQNPKYKYRRIGNFMQMEFLPPYLTSRDAIVSVCLKQSKEVKDYIRTRCDVLDEAAYIGEELLRATGKWK